MVLTNFELWAADGSSASSLPLDFDSNATHTRQLNPFDPRVVPQLSRNLNHLSSNGYYGFSYINAAHDYDNNNNHNMNNNNNNDGNNNLSGTVAYNIMANDVNGMDNTVTPTPQQTHALAVDFGSSAYLAGRAVNVERCKKRYFDMNDDDADAAAATTDANNYEISAKRCRFDDDFSAQYCNDFFQLPSTQIATQSCLMDTEEAPPQQQQQVDEAMFQNNNNIEKYEHYNRNRQLENVQTVTSAENHQQQHNNQHNSQQQQLLQTQQQQPQQPQQQNLYHHQQQHYQDDIHATIKSHFNNNYTCDTLTLNNIKQTCTETVFKSLKLKPKDRNPKCYENVKFYKNDNQIVANDCKIDDAMLFAQLHGGCLHHYHNNT